MSRRVRATLWLLILCLAGAALSQAAEARKHQTLQPTALGTPQSPLAKAAAPKLPPYVPGEVIVRFKAGVSEQAQAAVHARLKATVIRHLLLSRTVLVKLDGKRNERTAAATYERQNGVAIAQPNFIRHLDGTYPNDPSFSEQWGLNNTGQSVSGIPGGTSDADIDAPEAWDQTTGSPAATVAVVDSGVDVSHPDLAGRTVAGYDFVDNDPTPQDTIGHGTAMAGIIAAAGNDGIGITGVAWNARIMPLRVCDVISGCTDQRISDAFLYASSNGAKVANASLSGPSVGPVVEMAINAAANTLFVVSAGNGGADGQGDNNDTSHEYPCDFSASNIICATSTNQSDALTGFANYSANSVDIAAPGLDILSDWPGGQFAYLNGTSASTAYTSGAAALALSLAPPGSAGIDVESQLLAGGDAKSALAGKTATGRRLNARGAVPVAPAPNSGNLDPTFNGGNFVTTDFSGGGDFGNGVAIQSDGKIVVAGNSNNSDFAVARYNTNGSLDTSFDGDGKVVTDFGGSTDIANAVAIDPTTGKIVVAGYTVGFPFYALVRYNTNGSLDTSFDGDGKLVLSGAEHSGQVLSIAVQNDSKILLVGDGGGTGSPDTDFDLTRLNANGSPDTGFGTNGTVRTNFAGIDFSVDLKLQNDGKIVVAGGTKWHTAYTDFAVARYNSDGTPDTSFDGDGKVTTDVDGTDQGWAVDVQSDGKIVAGGNSQVLANGKIVFESNRDGNSEIYSMNPDGTGVTNLTNNSAADTRPAASPDGSKIAFASNRDGDFEIYTMFADGSNLTQMTTNTAADEEPAWSPDGLYLAFDSNRDGDYEIFVTTGAPNVATQFTTNTADDRRPDWSPDGTKIVFDTDRDGNRELYTIGYVLANGNPGAQTRLTNNAFGDFSPDWSPDGSKIAFDTDRDSNKEIYTMNADGSGQTNRTNNGGYDVEPSWSPDGAKITWDADRGQGNFDVYSMNADGSGQLQLTTNAAADFAPDWLGQRSVSKFSLVRYNANGSLDTTFDGDGKVTTSLLSNAQVYDLVIENNSALPSYRKIVAVGLAGSGSTRFALARYDENGSLDSTFGTGGTITTTAGNRANGVALQSDGNIVAAGSNGADFALARYTSATQSVSVTPSSDLDPVGQSVTVTASGYTPNSGVQVQQCREGAPSGNGCVTLQSPSTNSSGALTTSISVDYSNHGFSTTCEDPYCDVRVSLTTDPNQTAATPISFRQSTTVTGTPSAGQVAQNQAITLGQSITDSALVQGNSKGGTPTGTATFSWCGPVDYPQTCRSGTQIGSAVTLTAGASNSATATSAVFTPAATGRYCLRASYSGSLKYRLGTDAGLANCIMVRATPAAFLAVDDKYTAFKNFSFAQQASDGLLQNDIHPGPISVQPFSGATAQGGTVTIAADGSFTYIPATNFTGTDSFTYGATDGGVQKSDGTALIEVTALDPLEYTKYRYTKYRYTKYRDIAQAQLTAYAFCGPRLVSVNPQVTLFEPTLVQLSAALYDVAGNRLLSTSGYLVNDVYGGDPFQPNTLAWPDWTTPAPAGGAYVEVLLEADSDTPTPYTETVTVPCAT
jgi:uncharacterized delta-60 repeat protein